MEQKELGGGYTAGYRKSLVDTAWVPISFNKWLKNVSFMHPAQTLDSQKSWLLIAY